MTVDQWVFEAVESQAKTGATVRDVQRYIDEHHYEELAVDTIEASLEKLRAEGRLHLEGTRWHTAGRTSKEDALKKLFGDP
jgi:protoheme ferro-lyase